MKIKTILNAMRDAGFRVVLNDEPNKESYIRHRQFHAFRDRILRMDAEKDKEMENWKFGFRTEHLEVANLEKQIAEKDAKIDKLMELAVVVDRLRKHRMNTDYLNAMSMAKMILEVYDDP